jgi:hypothetical protein
MRICVLDLISSSPHLPSSTYREPVSPLTEPIKSVDSFNIPFLTFNILSRHYRQLGRAGQGRAGQAGRQAGLQQLPRFHGKIDGILETSYSS